MREREIVAVREKTVDWKIPVNMEINDSKIRSLAVFPLLLSKGPFETRAAVEYHYIPVVSDSGHFYRHDTSTESLVGIDSRFHGTMCCVRNLTICTTKVLKNMEDQGQVRLLGKL